MSIDIATYTTLNQYALLAVTGLTTTTNPGDQTTVSPGFSYGTPDITGANITGTFNGTQLLGGPATTSQTELTTLVGAINGLAPTSLFIPAPVSGVRTFTPGVYKPSASITFNSGESIVLDAGGNPNAQFFIISSSFITFASVASIDLSGGALNCNVFWLANSSGLISFTGTMPVPDIPGIFISPTSITFAAGSTTLGRLYAQTANVTFVGTSVVNGACDVPPTPPGPGPVPCFLADAPVLTPMGYAPIASLNVGDLVITPSGALPIKRVKITRVTASPAVNPYIIEKGDHNAVERLLISPNHCVETKNGMVEAHKLGLKQEEMTGSFDYYNLELPEWSNMIVAGVTVESLAPLHHIILTLEEFGKFVAQQFGEVTPELEKRIQQHVRVLPDGRIEVEVNYINRP